jgi:hypothetical protein
LEETGSRKREVEGRGKREEVGRGEEGRDREEK